MPKQNLSFQNTPDVGHLHTGHRQKMWHNFKCNPHSLTDTDMIEMALMLVIPRCDVRPAARRLLHEFKTLHAVVHAPVERLRLIQGLGEKSARIFPLLAQVLAQAALSHPAPSISLNLVPEIRAYCQAFQNTNGSCFHLLLLNIHNHLVYDETLTPTEKAPLTPVILTQKIVQQGVPAVIVVHHLAQGAVYPLQNDIDFAHTIDSILTELSIQLKEYVITTAHKLYFLKDNNLF